MAKTTPSMAKNQMRRSLLQIIDSHPTKQQVQQLRAYFENQCAYCGVYIDPQGRQGHLDHLLSIKEGGTNDIHNFVLACNICNGDEKRELPWQQFLQQKCESLPPSIYNQRLTRLLAWQRQAVIKAIDANAELEIERIINDSQQSFDRAVSQMRALRESLSKK
ncbi:MAG: HNH endonuclease signature motif containing protein [Psychrobacter sp.]|nr:HNH endonuclease signature motif containing protein [Psychrobacter sp.]